MHDNENLQSLAIGRFVKFWRDVHCISQEELAYRLNSSQRHISRIENGNTRPSETFVLEIAKAFNLGQRDGNHLLIAAGYTPIVKNMDFHSPDLKWFRKAMTMTLRALDPYPTVLLDSFSNILMVNKGWVGFYRNKINKSTLNKASNYYDFMFSKEAAGDLISNKEDTLSVILMSLTQRSLFIGNESNKSSEKLLPLSLLSHPNLPHDWQQRAARLEPMASFRIQMMINGSLKQFFSVSSTVGAFGPTAYASEPNLSIQTLYPEDESF